VICTVELLLIKMTTLKSILNGSDPSKIVKQITSLMKGGYTVTKDDISTPWSSDMMWKNSPDCNLVFECLGEHLVLDQTMVSFLWGCTAVGSLFVTRFNYFKKRKPGRIVLSYVKTKPYSATTIQTVLDAGFCFSWNCVVAYAMKGRINMVKMISPTVGDKIINLELQRFKSIIKHKDWPEIIRTLVQCGMPANVKVNSESLIQKLKTDKPEEVELIKFLENWNKGIISSPTTSDSTTLQQLQCGGLTHYVLDMEYVVNVI